MPSPRRWLHALLAAPVLFAAFAQPAQASVSVINPAPEASWNLNGPVYASVIVGDTVYLGGRFSQATSTDGATEPRAGLAAFSLSTKKLLPWAPSANGTVWALETDGSSLWLGGGFTKVNDKDAQHLAKLALRNGALDSRFDVGVNDVVRSLALDNGMLFVGGLFSKVGKVDQKFLAKVNATSGAVPKGFDPKLDGLVRAIVASPKGCGNDLYIAGNFRVVDGDNAAGHKVALISSANGKLSKVVFEKTATTRSLDLSPDGKVLYGGIGGDINSAVAWSTTTGQRLWRYKVAGDVHVVHYLDGRVWAGYADGTLDNAKARLSALDAATGTADPSFAPVFNQTWGVRTIAATSHHLVVAGNFTRVGGQIHRYVAFFGDTPTG